MSQSQPFGLIATLVGPVRPYIMTAEATGEIISGATVEYPGGKASVALPQNVAERMEEGQVWHFEGRLTVSREGKVRIAELTAGRQLEAKPAAGDAAIEFLEDAPGTAAKRTGAKS